MKRFLLLVVAIFSFSTIYAADNSIHANDNVTKSTTITNEDNDIIKVLVEASDTVADVCAYFEDTWAYVGLSIYCNTPGAAATPVTCSTFKIINIVCVTNDIIQLTIEGDFNGAAKRIVKETGEQIIYRMIGSRSGYKLEPTRANSIY